MLDLGIDDAQETLRELDQAIYNHEQWLADVTRTLVTGLAPDQRDVREDAHRQCRFGQWYYADPPAALQEHPSFSAIGTEHRHMHELAARLLTHSQLGTPSSMDYDSFRNAVERLRLEIYTLKRELEDVVQNRDPLTGAESRTGMLTALRESRELVRRHAQDCSVVIMDLDDLKGINDAFGHRTGDEVLAGVVRATKRHLRPFDKVFRYGGDEFVILLANTDVRAAEIVVDRLRDGMSGVVFATSGSKDVVAHVSFGIAALAPDVNVEDTVDRADAALYAAKASGRNRACVWEPSMSEHKGLA